MVAESVFSFFSNLFIDSNFKRLELVAQFPGDSLCSLHAKEIKVVFSSGCHFTTKMKGQIYFT